MGTGKQYDEEFKKQAIKLAKKIGTKAAADELHIPSFWQQTSGSKSLKRKNRELEELNEFLEKASAFFTANRRKSGKKNG